MTKVPPLLRRGTYLLATVSFLMMMSVINLGLISGNIASADQLTNRKLDLSSTQIGSVTTGSAGSYTNGQKTKHTFTFRIATSGNVGSVLIQYCTTAIGSCTSPTGLTAANVASVASQSGWIGGSFTLNTALDASTASNINNISGCTGTNGHTNCILVTRTAANENTGAIDLTLAFGGGASDYITNPTTATTFFAHIYTFATNTFSTQVDDGTVASSTATAISITAKVTETLGFSVTGTKTQSSGTQLETPGSSCTALTGSGAIFLGDTTDHTLSISQAYDNHTYFRVNTNSANGTSIQYAGDTLKKGARAITAATTVGGAASTVGSEQFGIGIDSSDTVSGTGYSFSQLTAGSNYNTGNGTITNGGTAKFYLDTASVTTPVEVAASTGYIACDTGSVRYIANISPNTPAGVYTTTFVYYAVPKY